MVPLFVFPFKVKLMSGTYYRYREWTRGSEVGTRRFV